MYSLIYRSVASKNLDAIKIKGINQKSIAFNKQHNITGCLLHHQGRFLQLLEGSKKSVLELFEKIEKDKQHHNVEVLHEQNSVLRMFNNWGMIYDDIHEKSIDKMKSFEEIYHSSDVVCVPNKSKLKLWKEVGEILKEERGSE